METYGEILLIAMPAFLVLVLLEKWYGWYTENDTVPLNDMLSSLSSGVTNVTKDVLGLSLAIISYGWIVDHVALTHVSASWLTFLIAFIVLDFSGYWVHRINHEYNIFWNNHIIHHSSEEFNLACALRQSISSFVRIFTVFLLPAAFLGVPTEVIAVVGPVHLFAQFWYHTQHIKRMGWLEYIIVTPAHHRVHHAINPIYLDKNYGQIFIFWDKLFGTFQEELANVPAVYGVTTPVRTWNPIKINFMHLWLLVKDAWRASKWEDKFKIWFMPLGWRPADVAEKHPVEKIEDVYNFEKYSPLLSPNLMRWSIFQFLMLVFYVFFLFGNIATIGIPGIFIYGAFVFLTVYAYTELMDKDSKAWIWESLKSIAGLGIILSTGDWFGLNASVPFGSYMLIMILVASPLVVVWFCKTEIQGVQTQKKMVSI
ncbi:MAG: alkylglycerol monooxygenase [Algoriphagus sp.]|jgi:alkylglycerol monooxygenase